MLNSASRYEDVWGRGCILIPGMRGSAGPRADLATVRSGQIAALTKVPRLFGYDDHDYGYQLRKNTCLAYTALRQDERHRSIGYRFPSLFAVHLKLSEIQVPRSSVVGVEALYYNTGRSRVQFPNEVTVFFN